MFRGRGGMMHAHLYTQTLMLFFISSLIMGKTVVVLSTQRVKTSLKMGKKINSGNS